jgi:hypothetical protein
MFFIPMENKTDDAIVNKKKTIYYYISVVRSDYERNFFRL